MKQLAGMSYDVTDIISEGNIDYLAKITVGDDELVKNAHVPSAEEAEQLPEEDFALVLYHPHIGLMKKLAIHDPSITKLNITIFKDRVDSFPDEIVKTAAFFLKKAAKHYRIDFPAELEAYATEKQESNVVSLDDINKISWLKKQANLTKVAGETEYALPSKKKYPIGTPALVKKAMLYFTEQGKKMAPKDKLEMAAHIKTAAIKHNVTLAGAEMLKYASLSSSRNPELEEHIAIRVSYSAPQFAKQYNEIDLKAGLSKIAEALEELDKDSGLFKMWNRSIEDPYLSVFGVKNEAFVKVASKTVTRAKLAALQTDVIDSELLADLKGPEGVEIFESLPMPLKNKIADLL